jgi:hypothetical protein
MVRRALFAAAVLLGATACDFGFPVETLVEDLRLIGINATPASLKPGESTQLTALVLDPTRTMPSTLLWIGCDADPYALNRSPCANPDVLTDSSRLTGGTGTLPPGVAIIGLGPRAVYRVPPTLFDPLAADDPRRTSGTVGIVLVFAVAETVSPAATPDELKTLFERVQKKEVKSILALFRIAISESDVRNENPVVDRLIVAGETWPLGARVLVREREPVTLDILAPESTFESYDIINPSGELETRRERVLTAWYSTTGLFSEGRTALNEGVKTIFTAPGDAKNPVPEKRTGLFYTVFRDTRGAQAWREWPLFVCEEGAAVPSVTSVEWPTTPDGMLVVRGNSLENLVDVVLDGVALEGSFIASETAWQGRLATGLPVTAKPLTFHARDCSRFTR